MQKITMDVGPGDVQMGFPTPKAGRVPSTVGNPTQETSKKGAPMYVFPLLPNEDLPCQVTDRETGETKEIMAGKGKAILKYYASLNPEALRYGSISKMEIAAKLKGSLWPRKGEFTPENLPQFAGKRVLAIVVNKTNDDGSLNANVGDVFPM